MDNEELYKQLKRLQAENERLKEEINRNGREWENHCNAQYWQMQSIIDKYKQALQEIREIVSKIIDSYIRPYGDFNQLKTILAKINEVIGAEE